MRTRIMICVCALIVLFAGCGAPTASPVPLPTFTPYATPLPIKHVIAATATATAGPPSEWMAPSVPDTLRKAYQVPGVAQAEDATLANTRIDITQSIDEVQGQSTWFYALVAPFPTVLDGVSFNALKEAWAGSPPPTFVDKALEMDQSTYEAMKSLFGGEPASGAVQILPAKGLVDALWQGGPQWGIVPFEALDPKMKVLAIDGESPIRKAFNQDRYPLKMTFACQGAGCATVSAPATNRDPSKLTTLIMTGVTALVRATAYKMDVNGVLYPGKGIRDMLREADITHISNEIPFAENCPAPVWHSQRLEFCSNPTYIGLLDDIGTDVVELTGNHMEDWSQKAMRFTLQLYKDHNIPVYGGGEDLAASQRAATIERNGMKFAFIGCNPVGPEYGWAAVNWPGAAPCGDYKWMVDEIKQLKEQGYIVVATFQYYEYYSPEPRPGQRDVFRMMVDAGADVVSGSQAHTPQAMEFDHGSFIHYGLGNLFFDQMNVTDYTRDEFLDRYVFYDGRMLSVDLVTAMLQDYSQPVLMGPTERADLLAYIFQASGWLPKDPYAKPKPTPTLVDQP